VSGWCWGSPPPAGRPEFVLDDRRVDYGSCSDSRRRQRTVHLGVPATWVPVVHSVCPHNEIAALSLRSLAPLPDLVFEDLGRPVCAVFSRLNRIASSYGGYTWSDLQTALSYSGALQRRYLEAERSLRVDGPVTGADSYLRPFLKAEKGCVESKAPKPRMIFPRSPRYNLRLASRLKPFEHWLWGRLTARRLLGGGVGRVVAKGLNPRQRANLVVKKFKALESCVVFEVDGKAFEAHVGPSQLEAEHGVYGAAFPRDGELRRLLREQLVLRGKLPCGAKFSREGGRASGDFNTGMGNSLIMLAVVVAVLRGYSVPYDVLVDGDNALVFLRGGDASRVLDTFAEQVLLNSGHEVTLERPVTIIEEIRFGQSAPISLGPRGWCMVRDYRKVLSGALSSHRWLREPRFSGEWMRGVAACELSLARGVPILQEWALELQALLGGPAGVRVHPHTDYFVMGAWLADFRASVPVCPETRVSFERAFGVEPEAQVLLEREFPARLRAAFGRTWETLDLATSDRSDISSELPLSGH